MGILIKRCFKKIRLVKIIVFAVLLVLFFSWMFWAQRTPQEIEKVYFADRDVELVVEIADTPFARQRGLSGREQLLPEQGMFFVFDTPGRHGFWMKDMNFSIDIFWLNAQGEIVFIKKNALPSDYPDISYRPQSSDALYVLETVAGFAEDYNIQIGHRLFW